MTHRSVEVPVIARVEGEGALHIAVQDGEITDLRLEIYEPPRLFEALATSLYGASRKSNTQS